MAYEVDEDPFDDFNLEDLPHDALDELETKAIQYTQNQPSFAAPASSDYGDDFEDEDLDDNVVIDELRSTPARNPAFQPRKLPQHHRNPPRHAAPSVSQRAPEKRLQANPPPRFEYSQTSTTDQVTEQNRIGDQVEQVALLQQQIQEVLNLCVAFDVQRLT
jgi:hypothetical protein